MALRHTDASRLSPLLAFKIIFIALISAILLGDSLIGIQWVGISLCVASAFVLNYSGEKLPWKSFATIVVTCFCFSISDLNAQLMIDRMPNLTRLHAVLLAACLSYLFSGFAACLAIPWMKNICTTTNFINATPFAFLWLLSIVFFFGAFAYLGVIFGNILQSTRGIFSVAIGGMLAKIGYEHIEQKTTKLVFIRRLIAAIMMCLAILLYVLPKF